MNTLVSGLDPSINFVEQALEGFIESRYVRKCPEYFICYLSSQSGCNRGCRFCHLTATKQTRFENVYFDQYEEQARNVLSHYLTQVYRGVQPRAQYVHYNFMARGEALSNPEMLLQADRVLTMLGQVALEHDNDLSVKFNVSTIMPRSLDRSLTKVFRFVQPTIYYSLYSANEDFRRHWMPNAMPLQRAIDLLLEWQLHSKKRIKIHHCFIQGQNDSEDDICRWADVLNSREMDWDFNLVRYNPYSTEQGQESSDEVIDERMQLIRSLCPGSVKIIPRVGFDVKASCGMFVEKKYGV